MRPGTLAIVAGDRSPGIGVLNLPSGYLESNIYMVQQTCHGKAIVQGNVSRVVRASLIDHLEITDLAKQRDQLVRSHVKYIVLERARDGLFDVASGRRPAAERLSQSLSRLPHGQPTSRSCRSTRCGFSLYAYTVMAALEAAINFH